MLILNDIYQPIEQKQTTKKSNEIPKTTNDKYALAYTLDLSTSAINYLQNTKDNKIAIYNTEALSYTKDLQIINKESKQWKIY